MKSSRYIFLLAVIAIVATLIAPVTAGAVAVGEEYMVTDDPHSQNQIEMWGDTVVYMDHRAPGNPAVYATDMAGGGEYAVSNTVATQNNPSVYGDIVVYMKKAKSYDADADNWEGQGDIWGYRISTGVHFPICTNEYEQGNPFIWGDWVIWVDGRAAESYSGMGSESRDSDLYGYNLSTGKEVKISDAAGGQHSPAIYENTLVYRVEDANRDDSIWCMDLATMQAKEIAGVTSDYPQLKHPNVYGDWITWYEHDYYYDGQSHYIKRVMAYNIKTEVTTEVTEYEHIDWGGQNPSPDVWNGLVVWADTSNATTYQDVEIHMVDLEVGPSSETTISTSEGQKGRPRISNGVVTWVGDTNPDTEEVGADVYAVRLQPGYVSVEGTDRYSTAIAASRKTFPGGADTVVIATGANWPDALSASALAGAVEGPVLLVKPGEIPAKVYSELTRLGAKNAYIVGGSAAIGDEVMSDLKTFLVGDVTRIAGANRYSTSALVATKTKQMLGADFDGTAMVATGDNFPDSVAAAALASSNGWPILLTEYGEIPASTMSALNSLDPDTCVVLGGSSVISGAVRSELADVFGAAPRVAGTNRYMTAAAIAQYGVDNGGMTWDGAALATGEDFADALSGGIMQGANNSVMLLTPGDSLHPVTAGKISMNKAKISMIKFVGGTAAIEQSVRDAAWTLIK